jgi:hypothetical protein
LYYLLVHLYNLFWLYATLGARRVLFAQAVVKIDLPFSSNGSTRGTTLAPSAQRAELGFYLYSHSTSLIFSQWILLWNGVYKF